LFSLGDFPPAALNATKSGIMRWRLPILAAIISGLLVWFFATPSKHDRAVRAYETAQIGGSRAIVEAFVGSPSSAKPPDRSESEQFPTAARCDSYSFFLVRYAFYFDASDKLVSKYMFTSE
jgi:hypothetical protein